MTICDMHCHILPGVDDGSSSFEESMGLLHEEYAQGVRRIILTPHFRRNMFEAPRSLCLSRFNDLRKMAFSEFGHDLQLFLGCEFHVCQDMTDILDKDAAYSMNGGDYVLTEFSGYHTDSDVTNYVNRLLISGWKPIIAHIERYPACREIDLVDQLSRMGALIQVNADAVIGKDGLRTRMFAGKLLKEGLVNLIGSDAHNLQDRLPHLGECADFLKKKIGQKQTEALMWNMAAEVLGI